MSWLARVFGGKKLAKVEPEGYPADLWCSFCGKHRREVKKLVAGPKVYICDACIALCVEIMQTESRQEGGDYHVESLLVDLERRGARARHTDVLPLLRAVLELAGDKAGVLRQVATYAARVSDTVTALAAVAAIAEAERGPHDDLNQAAMLIELGRRGEARQVLDGLGPPGEETARIRARLYRAWADLEQVSVTRPQLAVCLQTARELGAAVAVLPDDAMKDLLRISRYRVLTRAALALGDLDAAEEAAEAWALLAADNAEAQVALAEVRRARGDGEGTERAMKRARELAHPDGALARKLAAPSDGPFR